MTTSFLGQARCRRGLDLTEENHQHYRVPPSPNPSVQRRRLSFAAVVRARRKSLGLSQEKLAEKAGCDRQSINRVENAAYSPSLDRIFKLADALEVNLPDLFHDFEDVDRGLAQARSADRRAGVGRSIDAANGERRVR